MKKLALVLSGGGARGFAHIGVLKALKSFNIKPDIVAGTSMGAIVGGFYSAGMNLEEMEKLAIDFEWKKLAKFMFLPNKLSNEVKNDGILKYFRSILGDKQIEDLDIDFSAVSFDLKNNTEVIFDRGDLATALRASMAVPLVFSPLSYKNRILYDGGITNPLPINVVLEKKTNHIIAVNVMRKNIKKFSRVKEGIDIEYYRKLKAKKKNIIKKKMGSNFLFDLLKDEKNKDKIKEKLFAIYDFFDKGNDKKLSISEIVEKIFYITQNFIRSNRDVRNVDLLYEPKEEDVHFFDFKKSKKLINKSEREFKKILEESKMSDIL